MQRKTEYTPPRTITLDNKYNGAVHIKPWDGYAVQVVGEDGTRKVVKGPSNIILEYDETLSYLSLSTGTPKTDDHVKKTVYLQIANNKVSDIITAQTADMVEVRVRVSYRVNFEGEESKWFAVQDYTKFLCEHLRSMLRNSIKKHGIQDFNDNAIDIVRDTILGKQTAEKNKTERSGRLFEENNMRVYDVDVLDIVIGDTNIQRLLLESQLDTVRNTIELASAKENAVLIKEKETIDRDIAEERKQTQIQNIENSAEIEQKRQDNLKADLDAKEARQEVLDKIEKAQLEREKAQNDEEIRLIKEKADIFTNSHQARMAAINDKLIAAIQSLGDSQLAQELVRHLPEATGTIGLLSGQGGVVGLLKSVGEDSPMGQAIKRLTKKDVTENIKEDD